MVNQTLNINEILDNAYDKLSSSSGDEFFEKVFVVQFSEENPEKIEQININKNGIQLTLDVRYSSFLHVYIDGLQNVPQKKQNTFKSYGGDSDIKLKHSYHTFSMFDKTWRKKEKLLHKIKFLFRKKIETEKENKQNRELAALSEVYDKVFSDEINNKLLED